MILPFIINNKMLTTRIRYRVALTSIKHLYNRNRNLIVHHGLIGSSKNFRSLSKTPAFSNYVNSYLVDARNHGSSPHTETHTMTDLANDLHEYIQTHQLATAQKRLTLMGHSMGGLALMQFTKLYGSSEVQKYIDRVIIIDIPATKLSTRSAQMKTGVMLRRMLQIDLNQPTTQVFHEIDQRALTPDIGALLKSDIVTISPNQHRWRVNLKVLVDSYPHICDYELARDNPKNWTVPVEVIYGQHSGNFDEREKQVYQQFYPQMKQENFHMIAGAGHWVHFEKTEAFLGSVRTILGRDV